MINHLFSINELILLEIKLIIQIIPASFNKAVEHLGGLDIMINNAGILDDSKWSLMIDINIVRLLNNII